MPAEAVLHSAEAVLHSAEGVLRSAEAVLRSAEAVLRSAEGVLHQTVFRMMCRKLNCRQAVHDNLDKFSYFFSFKFMCSADSLTDRTLLNLHTVL